MLIIFNLIIFIEHISHCEIEHLHINKVVEVSRLLKAVISFHLDHCSGEWKVRIVSFVKYRSILENFSSWNHNFHRLLPEELVGDLVTPLVDLREIDVVDKDCHVLP